MLKQKYKKITAIGAIILTLILVVSMILPYLSSVLAKEPDVLQTIQLKETMSVDSYTRPEGTAYVGDTINVTINAENLSDISTNIYSLGLKIILDENKYEFVSGNSLIETSGFTNTFTYNKGNISLIWMSNGTTYLSHDTTDLCTFKIKVRENAEKDEKINLNLNEDTEILDNDENAYPLNISYNSLTVKEYKPLYVKTSPDKLTYFVNDTTLDLTNGILMYGDPQTKEYSEISMLNAEVSATGFDTTTAGKKTITLQYKGEKTGFDITVKDPQITGIEVKRAPSPTEAIPEIAQTNYIEGQSWGLKDDGLLTLKYENGTSKDITITEKMLSTPDISAPGTKEVTVTYSGLTTTYSILVEAKQAMSYSVEPKGKTVKIGTALDISEMKVYAYYNNGTTDFYSDLSSLEISPTLTEINTTKINQVGEFTVDVKISGIVKTSFDVNVLEKLATGIKVKTKPNKTTFIEDTGFTFEGGEIEISYDNGTKSNLSMSDKSVTVIGPEDMSRIGKQTVSVKWNGFETSYDIEIIKKSIESIEISNIPKTEYIEGQSLDITEGVIKVNYNNGTSELIAMDSEEVVISGFDSTVPVSKQTITLTYGKKTTSYDISIRAKQVTGIQIVDIPQNEYFIGSEIDTSKGTLNVKYDNGTEKIIALNSEGVSISGFDSSVAGKQKITVSYQGKITDFEVTVLSHERVDRLLEKIEIIDIDKLTIDDKANIEGLKTEYESLTELEKKEIPNESIEKLNNAIDKINKLIKEKDQSATDTIQTISNPSTGITSGSSNLLVILLVLVFAVLLFARFVLNHVK